MGNIYRLVFSATTTTELKFADASIATDGPLTVVLQNGERKFCIPTSNVIAIERIPNAAPAPDPEPEPMAADAS